MANKITMVNSGQIVARGWKGMKTHKGVETFTIKQHVNHVYWRNGSRKILLVDVKDFQKCWKNWKQEYKCTTFSAKAQKPSNKTFKSSYKISGKKTTSRSRITTRKPISRKRTTKRRTTIRRRK